MDNIKLVDKNRFALILNGIYRGLERNESAEADIEAIRFRSDFVSLRHRPVFGEMFKKLQQTPTTPRPDPTMSARDLGGLGL